MDPAVIEYFTAVVEGRSGIARWQDWRVQHADDLQKMFGRTRYLRLKLHPFEEIRHVLDEAGVPYVESDAYAWLDGVPGRCRYCGSDTRPLGGGGSECPQGCYRLMT